MAGLFSPETVSRINFKYGPPNSEDQTHVCTSHVSICIFRSLWPDSPASCRLPRPRQELPLLAGGFQEWVCVLIPDVGTGQDASAGWKLTRVKLRKTARPSVPTGSLWTLRVLCWQPVVWSPTRGNVGPQICARGGTSPLWITHSPFAYSGCNAGFAKDKWRRKTLRLKEKNKQTKEEKKTQLGIVSSFRLAGSWAGLQSAAAVTGKADETAVRLIGARFETRSKRTPPFARFLDVGLSSSPSATCSYRAAVINSALRQSDSFPS